MRGVCWITGLSCSGKTTLSTALHNSLKKNMTNLILLDGDVLRDIFGNDLGHKEEDRKIQIRRLQHLSKLLSNQGLFVIVAALYSNEELLNWNRNNFKNYYEIYLEASFEVLSKRDTRGLYGPLSSELNVVGRDIKWTPPRKSDIIINTDNDPDVNKLAMQIIENIKGINL